MLTERALARALTILERNQVLLRDAATELLEEESLADERLRAVLDRVEVDGAESSTAVDDEQRSDRGS